MSTKSPERDYAPSDGQLQISPEIPEQNTTMPNGLGTEHQKANPSVESALAESEVRREQAEGEWDRRDKNHPKTMAQNRQEINGTLSTGQDIEEKAVASVKRILSLSEGRQKRKLRTIGDGIQAPGPAEDLRIPRGRTLEEAAAAKRAMEEALGHDNTPEAA